jgi:hypothetical protein
MLVWKVMKLHTLSFDIMFKIFACSLYLIELNAIKGDCTGSVGQHQSR